MISFKKKQEKVAVEDSDTRKASRNVQKRNGGNEENEYHPRHGPVWDAYQTWWSMRPVLVGDSVAYKKWLGLKPAICAKLTEDDFIEVDQTENKKLESSKPTLGAKNPYKPRNLPKQASPQSQDRKPRATVDHSIPNGFSPPIPLNSPENPEKDDDPATLPHGGSRKKANGNTRRPRPRTMAEAAAEARRVSKLKPKTNRPIIVNASGTDATSQRFVSSLESTTPGMFDAHSMNMTGSPADATSGISGGSNQRASKRRTEESNGLPTSRNNNKKKKAGDPQEKSMTDPQPPNPSGHRVEENAFWKPVAANEAKISYATTHDRLHQEDMLIEQDIHDSAVSLKAEPMREIIDDPRYSLFLPKQRLNIETEEDAPVSIYLHHPEATVSGASKIPGPAIQIFEQDLKLRSTTLFAVIDRKRADKTYDPGDVVASVPHSMRLSRQRGEGPEIFLETLIKEQEINALPTASVWAMARMDRSQLWEAINTWHDFESGKGLIVTNEWAKHRAEAAADWLGTREEYKRALGRVFFDIGDDYEVVKVEPLGL